MPSSVAGRHPVPGQGSPCGRRGTVDLSTPPWMILVVLPNISAGGMTTIGALADDSPLTVKQAAQERRDAKMRLARYDLEYSAARDTNRMAVINRARAEYGLALYEFVQCLVTCAEAEDRQNLAEKPDAPTAPPQPDERAVVPAQTDEHADLCGVLAPAQTQEALALAHARHDECWQAYEQARRTGDARAVAAPRGEWELALFAWMRALVVCREAEDRAKIAATQERRDTALTFRPGDAFPGTAGRVATLVAQSKEHARREALRRDRDRY